MEVLEKKIFGDGMFEEDFKYFGLRARASANDI